MFDFSQNCPNSKKVRIPQITFDKMYSLYFDSEVYHDRRVPQHPHKNDSS